MKCGFLLKGRQRITTVTIIPPSLRRDYLDALNRTHKGDDGPFINFIAGVCYESAKEDLRLMEG